MDIQALEIAVSQENNLAIVRIKGRIIRENRDALRIKIEEVVSRGVKGIALDFGGVEYIDSSGLGELVSAYTTVRNKQGDVKLLNLTAKAKDLLQMTKLLTVFDVYDDEATAINKLKTAKSV